MLKISVWFFAIFTLIKCENPIQSVNDHVLPAQRIIYQGLSGERCTAIAASPRGPQLAFIIRKKNASNQYGKNNHVRDAIINRLVILDSDSLKTKYQFDFGVDSLSNLTWSADGKFLIMLQKQHIILINSQTGTFRMLSLPFEGCLPLVRWGPTPADLAVLIPFSRGLKQGVFNMNTQETFVIKTALPRDIIDFSWSFDGKHVAYCLGDSSLIRIYAYHLKRLTNQIRLPIAASLFRWMRGNAEVRNKLGYFALFKTTSEIGIFYLRTNTWQAVAGLHPESTLDICWAFDGQNIFYITQENGDRFKIIGEQILYVNS